MGTVVNGTVVRQAAGTKVAAVYAGIARAAADTVTAPSRTVYLDANYADASAQLTSSVQGALVYARSLVAGGGSAEIRMGYRMDGEPFAQADLEDEALAAPYGSDALDASITPVRVGAGGVGTTPADAAFIAALIAGEIVFDALAPGAVELTLDALAPGAVALTLDALPAAPGSTVTATEPDEDGYFTITTS